MKAAFMGVSFFVRSMHFNSTDCAIQPCRETQHSLRLAQPWILAEVALLQALPAPIDAKWSMLSRQVPKRATTSDRNTRIEILPNEFDSQSIRRVYDEDT
jgi:hypothetical protein